MTDQPRPLSDIEALAQRIDAVLPQTQCTRCGYPDCASYARAIARGEAEINQCPPGGTQGMARIAAITGKPVSALNPLHGQEGPRAVAVIDEDWCIGCTKCIKACPTDAIVGIHKRMHTIMDEHCTGCELCVQACPVDCIAMEPVTGNATGWAAWSGELQEHARTRYAARQARLGGRPASTDLPAPPVPSAADPQPTNAISKSATIAAILARARQAATKDL